MHPRTSSTVPPLVEKRPYSGRSWRWARWLLGKEGLWQPAAGRPHRTVADEPGETTGITGVVSSHRFKPGDRASAVDNQDRCAAFDPVDQGAQVVLGFADASLL